MLKKLKKNAIKIATFFKKVLETTILEFSIFGTITFCLYLFVDKFATKRKI